MEDAREAASTRLPLPKFPSNVVHHILKFSGNLDRLSLAATSKGMLNEVEVYSKSALARFKTKHGVDETFDARIHDQSNIVTTRSKPVELPSRYLLWASKRTYLYKLGEPRQGCVLHCRSLALSPSGNRILIAENGIARDHFAAVSPRNNVHVVDLPTKQRLCMILHEENTGGPARVFWFGDLIVTCSSSSIRVWSETGQLKHEHHAGTLLYKQWKQHPKGVMYISGRDKLQCLDVQTGVLVTHSLSEITGRQVTGPVTERKVFEIVAICDGKWLILNVRRGLRDDDKSYLSEIFSIDISNYSIKQQIKGRFDFDWLVQAADSPSMIYGSNDEDLLVDVFEIVDGRLSQLSSFQVTVGISKILAVYESNIVAKLQGGHKLGVFNAENGKLDRSLVLPPRVPDRSWYVWDFKMMAEVSKTRQELFVGLSGMLLDGDVRDSGKTVAAYCLNESDE